MASSNAVQSETIINTSETKNHSNDNTFTFQFYGKFRVQAPKIEHIIKTPVLEVVQCPHENTLEFSSDVS